MLELVVRLAFSLAVVLGLLTLLARVGAKRFRGSSDAPIRVVHRQALSRGSAVAVVSVGSRVLVVGTTEQQVSLLTELDPDELEELAPFAVPQLAGDPEDDHFDIEAELAAAREARTVSATPAASTARSPSTARAASAASAATAAAVSQGVLAGSALSAQTWRQALAVATRRQEAS